MAITAGSRLFVATVAGLNGLLSVECRRAFIELGDLLNIYAGGVRLLDKVNVPVMASVKNPFIRLPEKRWA